MAFPQHLCDERRNGDDRIRFGKQPLAAEERAGTFGQMPAENHEWAGLGQPGSQQGGPVIIPMMGVDDSGTGTSQQGG